MALTLSDEDRRSRRRRVIIRIVACAAVVVAIVAIVVISEVSYNDPEEAVAEYLTAVADKDVDEALDLAGGYQDVPYGREAAFLTADAIADDWWVVSVEEAGEGEYSSQRRVKATITGENGISTGEFVVTEHDDDWYVDDPFVIVTFPQSPLSYVQANDQIVRLDDESPNISQFELFPGPYRFFQSVPDVVDTPRTEPVAAFPADDSVPYDQREHNVVPGALTPSADTVHNVQRAVDDHIDECATFGTADPHFDCPFVTDGHIDTKNGKRVDDPWGLSWKVMSYPEITVTDRRAEGPPPGLAVGAAEPGTVTLSGTGLDTNDKVTTFTVTCDIDVTGYRATIDADGHATLDVRSADSSNTCRRKP